jgi:hypothetical protein
MIALALPCDGMDSSIEGGSNPISPFFIFVYIVNFSFRKVKGIFDCKIMKL